MSKNYDETVMRLHTDQNGIVWFARGLDVPTSSEKNIDTFMLTPVCSGKSAVFRLIGAAQNAELICGLFLRLRQKEILSVELGGPNIFDDNFRQLDAQQVVMRMNGVRLPASRGGWHTATYADYNIYGLLARLNRNGFMPDTPARIHFGSHPIAKILQFIPTLSESDAAVFAATVIDPRWFSDRRTTDFTKNAFNFLGLTPASQRRVSDPTVILTRVRDVRCARVLAAWKSKEISPDSVDLKNPANFLYRIWHAAGGGAKGDLRASQAFVQYAVANWLSALEQRAGVRDGLFAPNLYFKTPAEQKAYTQYAAAVS